jgi:hypothetical protein
MTIAIAIIVYIALVLGGLRFFQTVHRWDEEVRVISRRDLIHQVRRTHA